MSIVDFETPTAFGALDSAAIGQGEPFSAHILRAMGMSSNHLALKGQMLSAWVWPTENTSENAPAPFTAIATHQWRPITPAMHVPKRMLLNRGTVQIRGRTGESTSTETVQIQVVTRAAPFNARATSSSVNVCELTENGDYADVELDDLPLDEGLEETIQVYIRGIPSEVKGSTETYTNSSINNGPIDQITNAGLYDASADWKTSRSGAANWADGGHYVQLEDSGGNAYGSPRTIIAVVEDYPATGSKPGTWLYVDPPYGQEDISFGMAGGYYTIYRYLRLDLAGISLAAKARSF